MYCLVTLQLIWFVEPCCVVQARRGGEFRTFNSTNEIGSGAGRQNNITSWNFPVSILHLWEMGHFKDGGLGAMKEWNTHLIRRVWLAYLVALSIVRTCSSFSSYLAVRWKQDMAPIEATYISLMRWTYRITRLSKAYTFTLFCLQNPRSYGAPSRAHGF